MIQAKNVDSYVRLAPKETREKLKELRKIITTVAPAAEERLSYGMPYYSYKKQLVYFAFAKKHIGLYIPPPIIAENKKELKDYKTAKATVQFPLDKKLPVTLIKKLIKARMKYNEEKEKSKRK
ncbi:DUF1801 domain-containing protein [Candidatus Nomurabacteria bacterium]|nr:MAG: DUF1801 domain-containing protein [Candidatus Nomurabacteria bacterium]